MMSIAAAKVDQAAGILKELEIDCWLTFVRETTAGGDPVLPLILGQTLTWQSALIMSSTGERIAIVGKFDDEAVRSGGVWTDTTSYVEGIAAPLCETLTRLDPKRIAVNYSKNDVMADGLSHGMYQLLGEHLAQTPYADRLCSAEEIITKLRGRKTEGEVARLRGAIEETDAIFAEIAKQTAIGQRETEIAEFARGRAAARGLGLAWETAMCPIVTTGPDSMVGHGIPSHELTLEPGRILHLDFGVRRDDYCSDLQRCWYTAASDDRTIPAAVQTGFAAVRDAIQAAAAILRPGCKGYEVDAAARESIMAAGYPEYQHATGHQVGRSAHDGGAILGPRWERYGRTPYYELEPGNVFTLELGIDNLDGRGYLGLEEMVLVTESGCEFLSDPQLELPLL